MLNIIEKEGRKWVSAIELHSKAFNNKRYSDFVKMYLIGCDLVSEGNEFVIGQRQTSGGKGGRPVMEYFITMEYAKEIFATVRTKEARSYLRWLISLESKVDAGLLLNHEQVIYLTQLKEVFKYVANCKEAESLNHKAFVLTYTGRGNPHAAFHDMRNELLSLRPEVIDERLKQYCIDNQKPYPKGKDKTSKLILLNKYEVLRNGVWDFLYGKGHVNAMALADLVKRMAEVENSPIYRSNENNMFQQREDIHIKQLK